MDELTRALGRKYRSEPSPENAALYIRSLERIWGDASDPCLLLDIWGSLILGLFDPNGINLAVYDSLLDLTALLFGKDARDDLNNHVDATDGGFYLGSSEAWFDDFLLSIDYKCCHPPTCSLPAYGHHKCQALINHGNCNCPGCYTYEAADLQTIDLCWHHYQIMQSRPKIEFGLDIQNI
jgi:hypothetical protein